MMKSTVLLLQVVLLLLAVSPAALSAKPPLTRVVSDFHVGSIWFQQPDSQLAVMTMLESMTHPDTPVTRLVLLGDIFDFWLIPIDQMPLPLEQVVHNDNLYGFNLTRMSDTIRDISNNGVEAVCLTQSNHDIEMDAALAKFA